MFRPSEDTRFAGIRPRTPPSWKHPLVLPALQGRPVVESRMYGNGLPLLSTLCEKSP